ncbi:hypothetical protein YC2023_011496 [Brassica napus]
MLQEHVPKSDAPLITPRHLADADGFVCGFPTRFGMMSVQFKAFLDVTGLNNLMVSQPESSTALGLKVVVKKPPRKFLLSIQNNTSLKTLASVISTTQEAFPEQNIISKQLEI